jgi:hypothetical protein
MTLTHHPAPSIEEHTFTNTDADTDRGIPTAARCSCGAWTWQRPDGDEHSDTLPEAARAHRLAATAAGSTVRVT